MAAAGASPLAVLGSGALAAYWRFQRAVAAAQLAAWLPAGQRLLVDISGPQSVCAARAAAAGHRVVRVRSSPPGSAPAGAEPARAGNVPRLSRPGAVRGAADPPARRPQPPGAGQVVTVAAEPASLSFLAAGCADGVIAEDSALSRHLMAEDLAAEIARVLRPGGELLCCVDSLVLGMAILAEQHRWAHLTDVPNAEVVLVPWPDGTITRCFGAAQFRDLLTEAGLDVRWIRPRTVLSPSTVDHVLRREPGAVARLVRAEMAAGAHGPPGDDADEPFGIYLLAAARKPE